MERIRDLTSNDFDLDKCYPEYNPKQHSRGFSRRSNTLAISPKVKLITPVNRSFKTLQLSSDFFLKCLAFEIFCRPDIFYPVQL